MKKMLITLIVGLIILTGCVGTGENLEGKVGIFYWTYYEQDGALFNLGFRESYNPLKLHEVTALIVKYKATEYSHDNAMRFKPCGASPKYITFCSTVTGFKNKGFIGKNVDIYFLVDIGQSLAIPSTSANAKSISEIKQITQSRKLYIYSTYIPEVDERGVPKEMKWVSDSWCSVNTNTQEYGENKPKCKAYIDRILK